MQILPTHLFFTAVPMMNIPDVSVSENAGPVVPCAKVENPVEMAFNLLCTTVEIAGGATGMHTSQL